MLATTVAGTVRAFLLPYADYFRARGWIVDAAANGLSQCPVSKRAFNNVWDIPWSRGIGGARGLPGAVARFQRIVESGDYDIVHVHTPIAAFIGRLALRGRREQVVYTAHGFHFHPYGSPIRNMLFRLLERWAGRWTDRLVTINQADHDAALRYSIVGASRLVRIPGIGVDTACYSPERVTQREIEEFRANAGLRTQDKLFTTVAEFNPGKRHSDAIRALVRAHRADIHLAFAGDGPGLSASRRLAESCGVGDRVHFLGFRGNIPAIVRASIATLLPSEREGLPRSILESLSLGVPVIGANVRGIRDLVNSGNGILFELGDVAAIARAIVELAGDPQRTAQLGAEGRRFVEEFDLSRILRMHEHLYESLLSPAEMSG